MKMSDYGGNCVKKIEWKLKPKNILGTGPYEYYLYNVHENEELQLNKLRAFTIFILSITENAKIIFEGMQQICRQGDCIQFENCSANLKVADGSVALLVAGTKQSNSTKKNIFTKHEDIYRVAKPWGYELWINGQHPGYALKKIFIKAGTKTSLQYHNFKQETNVLFQGNAKLHYKKNIFVENDFVTSSDIGTVTLEPVSVIDVSPTTLHRLEAMTDILLFEVSTPYLDDVVRVQDDNKRPNGRLNYEHVQ